jgi:hypothetical protein
MWARVTNGLKKTLFYTFVMLAGEHAIHILELNRTGTREFFSDFFQAIQCLMMDRYILQQKKLQNK